MRLPVGFQARGGGCLRLPVGFQARGGGCSRLPVSLQARGGGCPRLPVASINPRYRRCKLINCSQKRTCRNLRQRRLPSWPSHGAPKATGSSKKRSHRCFGLPVANRPYTYCASRLPVASVRRSAIRTPMRPPAPSGFFFSGYSLSGYPYPFQGLGSARRAEARKGRARKGRARED